MRTLFTVILSMGMYLVYGQYSSYVPQIPVEALYRNMQYKQQLYDQRREQLQERIDYSYSLIQQLNQSDFDYYLKSLNANIQKMGDYDLSNTDDFYSLWNYFNRFDAIVKERIP